MTCASADVRSSWSPTTWERWSAEGSIAIDGEPDEVGRHYLALNFKAPEEDPETAAGPGTKPSAPVTVRDVWVEDDAGQRVGGLAPGDQIHVHVVLEAH